MGSPIKVINLQGNGEWQEFIVPGGWNDLVIQARDQNVILVSHSSEGLTYWTIKGGSNLSFESFNMRGQKLYLHTSVGVTIEIIGKEGI